jgi:cytochrome oxidase Cu insertion factor (SCO1/SenC/PrrC family)/FtsP/CotA-like multicopper oxidase with cupredoxin domain
MGKLSSRYAVGISGWALSSRAARCIDTKLPSRYTQWAGKLDTTTRRNEPLWLSGRLAVSALVILALAVPGIFAPVAWAQEECDGAFIADGSCVAEDTEELLEGLPEPNEGAFDGGETGTFTDAGANNAVPEDETDDSSKFNVPTGGPPSPLFGAQSFIQRMLRFEEFGNEPLPATYVAGDAFPTPLTAQSAPEGPALDQFLQQDLFPAPSRLANDQSENPWRQEIENFLGRELDSPPAEGRPPGEDWAHQRWNDFPPAAHFQTAMTGARINGGLRDSKQRHGYTHGEFGPGGLYYNTTGATGYDGSTSGMPIAFHPDMPVQDPRTLWTFDGTLPPKLLVARYGEPILLRHYNALPIDPAENMGFGLHTIATHEHNGHQPAESDGYTNAFFFPGQFYDYRWPLQLAGHDSVNTDATDPRAATPCVTGESLRVLGVDRPCTNGTIQIPGDWRETMSTHWFHDHMLDFTAQNVYKGNAAMMNYYSAIDRGNEGMSCRYEDPSNVNLCLPSGTALDWGNRDYDIQLLIADKAWDQTGQLWFNIFNLDGFVGDHLLTNWLYHPYFEVRARRYRFRILNGSVSRYFKLALVKQVTGDGGEMPGPPSSGISYDRVPFHLVANDGNIMEHAVAFDGTLGTDRGHLPTQSIAERYDIVVDFAQFEPGDKLYFVNTLDHKSGRRPNDAIPLGEVLSEQYQAVLESDRWKGGDPAVGKFLELRVMAYAGTDSSMNPADYVRGKQAMIPLPRPSIAELESAVHREFTFGRSSGTDQKPWTVKANGGSGLSMDPRRATAAPNIGDVTDEGLGHLEIWHIKNGGGGWSHPIHIHFEEGIIIARGGELPPEWEKWARKDMYRIGNQPDSTDSVDLSIRFREFAGTFMEHCHNTQHEDHAMLLRWDIERPGQLALMPTPIPTWDGVEYVDSVGLPTFRTGDLEYVPEPESLLVLASGIALLTGLARRRYRGASQRYADTSKASRRAEPKKHLFQWSCVTLIAVFQFAEVPAVAGVAESAPSEGGASRWGANYFPNVPLVTHDGKSVRFFDDLIKDKVVAINFIFTSCRESCPLETARMANVQEILSDRVGQDVFLYSISIDPETDTPEVLKAYREKFNAKPGWVFLTGKEEDITLLRRKLGLYIEEIQGEDTTDHNLNLVIGNQATGRWMKRSPFENPYVLATQIGGELHNWKLPRGGDNDYANAPRLRNISKGESLFRTRCAACHTVGGGEATAGGERLGPDLLGVTKKREPAWLARWVAEPDKMLAERDPIALQLFEEFDRMPMPNARLNEVEVEHLIRYLDAESLQVAKTRASNEEKDPHAHH